MISLEELSRLDNQSLRQAIRILKQIQRLDNTQSFDKYYPDEGPVRRALYTKHLAFFSAGTEYRERLFLAANRVGKSEGVGGYELTLHLTGRYPEWWQGRRFNKPISAWAAGDTAKTTRDIIQRKLLGPTGDMGTGLIPSYCIDGRPLSKPGVPDAVEIVKIKHVSGGTSTLTLKSYDQRREAFQGTEQDVIWLDEEPPHNIYVECLMRTMTTDGLILCTFTPLQGLSDTVLHYLPNGRMPEEIGSRYVITATWDDAPHLSDRQKEELWASIPPYQRDSRTKGIPQLGSGAIYPLPESDILCRPFDMPAWWPKAYALDVGWNKTAALWGSWDRDSDIVYLWSEHYRGQAEPVIHAHAIRARGEWIPGVVDPAARGRGQLDGKQFLSVYRDLGLNLYPADNAVESGIYAVWDRLSSGRLKVFHGLENWLDEYRLYRRDEAGRVVKDRDHLMDCTRYLIMTGLHIAQPEPRVERDETHPGIGRSAIAGY